MPPTQKFAPAASGPPRAASGWVMAQAAILILAGVFVFAPVWHGAWLWDDGELIANNPLLRVTSGLWKFWSDPPGPDYFPLTSSVEWFLWNIFGDNPTAFHVASLGLHLLGAFLLWRLFARIGLRLAWFGALLYAVHPLAVESVAWVSELKNTVSQPLLFAALLAWLNYDERRRPRDYLAALLFFMAALLAKTSVVMLPFILLLHAWWKYGRVDRRRFFSTVPFFALALVLGLITVFYQRQWAIGADPIDVGGLGPRFAGAGWAVLFYLEKNLWPAGLLPIYPMWDFKDLGFADFLPWLLLAAIFFWIWIKRATWGRHALFGGGFFLLNLAPVLGFITMSYMRIAWVADHFVYLPMIGLLGLAMGLTDRGMASLPRWQRPLAVGALALLALVFAWQSHDYAKNFRGQPALWAYTLRGEPDSWWPQLDLGLSLETDGRYPEAVSFFEKSFQSRTDFYGAYLAMGNTLAQMGRPEKAIPYYQVAVRLNPASISVGVNFSDVLQRVGRTREAGEQCEALLVYHPDSADAHYNLAYILLKEGRRDEAIAHFEAALKYRPDLTAARDALNALRAIPPGAK